MNKSGPIIIIEDDFDDQEMLKGIFEKLNYNNAVLFFESGNTALEYLEQTDIRPFLILSDINMPLMNGLELRKKIHNNEQLKIRCIPYLFFSTSAQQETVVNAYSSCAQGFFIKPSTYAATANTIQLIMEYWSQCTSPNHFYS